MVITTPNADYLPNVNLNHQIVICRRDGRWGPHDWTQWPQWYFDDYDHFPYILHRPAKENLAEHPLRRLWWDMNSDDFVEEAGCGLTGIGRLREEIGLEFYNLRQDLMRIVYAYKSGTKEDQRKLHAAAATMRHCTATLRWTPQTYLNVVQTVTATQRYYLETQAMLDKIRIREEYRGERPATVFPFIGTVTNRESVVSELFDKGIPVWYVRAGAFIPRHINIIQQMPLADPHPSLGVVVDRWPNAPVFYTGPLSPGIYFATGKWRPGTIDLSRVGQELPPEADPEVPPPPVGVVKKAPHSVVHTLPAQQASRPSSSSRLAPAVSSHGQYLIVTCIHTH